MIHSYIVSNRHLIFFSPVPPCATRQVDSRAGTAVSRIRLGLLKLITTAISHN